MTTRRRAILAFILLVGALLSSAQPAAAHDQLVETTPAAGSTVEVAPEAVTLRFNNDVLELSHQILVRDPSGNVVVDTEGVVDGKLVSAQLPADLGTGTFTVAWRVVAGDGHPVQGSFEFSVGAPSTPSVSARPTKAPSAADGPDFPADAAWLALAAAAVLTGFALAWRRRRRHRDAP